MDAPDRLRMSQRTVAIGGVLDVLAAIILEVGHAAFYKDVMFYCLASAGAAFFYLLIPFDLIRTRGNLEGFGFVRTSELCQNSKLLRRV